MLMESWYYYYSSQRYYFLSASYMPDMATHLIHASISKIGFIILIL